MAEQAMQDYKTHRMYVPWFHFVTFGILVLNLVWSLVRVFSGSGWLGDRIMAFLVALALILVAFYARTFVLKVQDRVIRLEEQVRLGEILPDDLRPRIPELSPGQLIALRFASDAEAPGLVRKVLDEKIASREAIKKLIKDWRADHFRA